MTTPTKIGGALARLDSAARDVWEALSPAQQRALRSAYVSREVARFITFGDKRGDTLYRIPTSTAASTRKSLVKMRLVEPTARRAKFPNRTLTPAGLHVRAADPEQS